VPFRWGGGPGGCPLGRGGGGGGGGPARGVHGVCDPRRPRRRRCERTRLRVRSFGDGRLTRRHAGARAAVAGRKRDAGVVFDPREWRRRRRRRGAGERRGRRRAVRCRFVGERRRNGSNGGAGRAALAGRRRRGEGRRRAAGAGAISHDRSPPAGPPPPPYCCPYPCPYCTLLRQVGIAVGTIRASGACAWGAVGAHALLRPARALRTKLPLTRAANKTASHARPAVQGDPDWPMHLHEVCPRSGPRPPPPNS